jgi:hypothetical protein
MISLALAYHWSSLYPSTLSLFSHFSLFSLFSLSLSLSLSLSISLYLSLSLSLSLSVYLSIIGSRTRARARTSLRAQFWRYALVDSATMLPTICAGYVLYGTSFIRYSTTASTNTEDSATMRTITP